MVMTEKQRSRELLKLGSFFQDASVNEALTFKSHTWQQDDNYLKNYFSK